jgi:hypothetical protein
VGFGTFRHGKVRSGRVRSYSQFEVWLRSGGLGRGVVR